MPEFFIKCALLLSSFCCCIPNRKSDEYLILEAIREEDELDFDIPDFPCLDDDENVPLCQEYDGFGAYSFANRVGYI